MVLIQNVAIAKQKLKTKQGNIIEIPETNEQLIAYSKIEPTIENVEILSDAFVFEESMGKKVENHQGAHYYTIGQRKGLHIGGRPLPSFVIGINTETNSVYSGQTENHTGLNRYALLIKNEDIHTINQKYILKDGDVIEMLVRVRYRQALQKAKLIKKSTGLYILFEEKQKGITPGQFAAWYLEDELIGSGVISH
jgi:tRNA-specific 2-thiouridylase